MKYVTAHEMPDSFIPLTSRPLALSPGNVYGFAAGQFGAMISGSWYKRGASQAEAVAHVLTRLDELHASFPPSIVLLHTGKKVHSSSSKGAINSRIQAVKRWADEKAIPVAIVADSAIRRSFTGRGTANANAIAWEAERRGIMVAGSPEAFAVALLDWTMGSKSIASA